MKFPHARILVFCRAPIAGQVKTRLAKSIGDAEAALCHQALAGHCLQVVTTANLAPVQLWCTPDSGHPFFQQQRDNSSLLLQQQSGRDLGDKMYQAFGESLQDAEYAVVIGTDCPALTQDYIALALSALKKGAPAVIGPAEDGGYVLLGLRENNKRLFEDMPWGSSAVFSKTCNELADGYQVLPMLWDIDVNADLQRLKQENVDLELSDNLRQYLQQVP